MIQDTQPLDAFSTRATLYRASLPEKPIVLRAVARLGCWVLLCVWVPGVAAQHGRGEPAQVVWRANLIETNRLEWRGIRRNAGVATAADLSATVLYRGMSASAGLWTSAELESTRSEPRPDLRSGGAGPTQWSLWGQVGYRRGPLSLAAGVIHDRFVRPGDDPSTAEGYVTGRLQAGRWSGSLSLYESLDGVSGASLEPSVTFHHFANPFSGPAVTWSSTLRAGVQLGERDPDAGALVPGPEETGLTHLVAESRLRAAIPVSRSAAILLATGPQLRFNRDPATRRGRDGSEADVRFWWVAQAGVSFPVRARE